MESIQLMFIVVLSVVILLVLIGISTDNLNMAEIMLKSIIDTLLSYIPGVG